MASIGRSSTGARAMRAHGFIDYAIVLFLLAPTCFGFGGLPATIAHDHPAEAGRAGPGAPVI